MKPCQIYECPLEFEDTHITAKNFDDGIVSVDKVYEIRCLDCGNLKYARIRNMGRRNVSET